MNARKIDSRNLQEKLNRSREPTQTLIFASLSKRFVIRSIRDRGYDDGLPSGYWNAYIMIWFKKLEISS